MQLAIVPLTTIDFGDRRRADYGDITELAHSIKERGLIQPLAVCKADEDQKTNGFDYLLLAGGRRFKALTHAGIDTAPIRIFDRTLSEVERRSIELAENFYRKNLDFMEEIALQREIHELQESIHGKKISTSPDAEGWSLKDTAELLGVSKQTVQKDVQLARAVDAAPELFAEAKNKSDAAKILKSVGEEMIRNEMLKRAKAVPSSAVRQSLLDCYQVRDFFDGAATIPDGSINFVELDPPYAIDLKNAKSSETDTLGEYNEISSADYPTFMRRVLAECYRTMANHSWMVVWFAPEPWFEEMYTWITEAGFSTSRMVGIWTKPTGQTKWPAKNLGNAYEMFFIARKGDPALIQQGRKNIFDFPPVPPQFKIHPTERPVELINEILSTFCSPGARVLVPFLGSGTTLLSAASCNMTGLGFDISTEYKDRYIIKVHKMGEV